MLKFKKGKSCHSGQRAGIQSVIARSPRRGNLRKQIDSFAEFILSEANVLAMTEKDYYFTF